jgi:hypothetical protein
MSREVEVKVDQLEQRMRQAFAALHALVERMDAQDVLIATLAANAVVEGDEIIRPARNGKIKAKKADR